MVVTGNSSTLNIQGSHLAFRASKQMFREEGHGQDSSRCPVFLCRAVVHLFVKELEISWKWQQVTPTNHSGDAFLTFRVAPICRRRCVQGFERAVGIPNSSVFGMVKTSAASSRS